MEIEVKNKYAFANLTIFGVTHMKTFLLFLSLITISAPRAFAAKLNCAQTVSKATLAVAHPGGNKPNSSVFVSSTVTLINQENSILNYKIQVDFDINDGSASDGFPPEIYSVTAVGSEKSCKATKVELVQ